MNLPNTFLDHEGYPTDEYLDWIRNFEELSKLTDFAKVIMDNWQFEGCELRRAYGKKRTFILHTWGWSGNEDIIDALRENTYFFLFLHEYHTGGHFYFKIPV